MLNIKNDRELFVDNYLIDTQKTTAEKRIHHPVRREVVMCHDDPWEGSGTDYHNFFYDNGVWRMYYLGWWFQKEKFIGTYVCYAESLDGIHWIKPKLGICEFDGSKDNNIIVDTELYGQRIDNFMVFRDDNPACPPAERYKAVASRYVTRNLSESELSEDTLAPYEKGGDNYNALGYYVSEDGLHWKRGGIVTSDGAFDSLNVIFWDSDAEKYRCYFRSAHTPGCNDSVHEFNESHIRDVRYIESDDFVHWTKPRILDFGESEDIPLYTNVMQNYYRAPQIKIGFPSRYIYRRNWNGSFDELCGKEARLERIKRNPRLGLTLTDCIFISTRNGWQFDRQDEAFIRPEPEDPYGWVYGTAYPARGMIETPSDLPGADPEISMYVFEKHFSDQPSDLTRYTLRADGFVSMHAGASEKSVVTKPFVFEGNELRINFATSARGYAYVTLEAEDGTRLESCETFGNSIDRLIHFNGDLSSLSGKTVTMTVRLLDADLYSFRFI